MNLEPKMLKQRRNVLKEKKIFGGGKEKLSGKKKTKRKSLVIKQVPVDLKSHWAFRNIARLTNAVQVIICLLVSTSLLVLTKGRHQ